MSIARTANRRRWAWAGAGCAGLLLVAWAVDPGGVGPEPGDTVGRIFGVVALVLLLVAMAYSARRHTLSWSLRLRLGRARTWLLVHLVGGGLFLFAVLAHSGPGLPTGMLSWALWILSLWTVLSGAVGLAVQSVVPRALVAMTAEEVHFDRIPELVSELRVRAENLVEDAQPAVCSLYSRRLAPVLARPRRDPSIFLDTHRRSWHDAVAHLRQLLEDDEQERLAELEQLVRAKHDLDAQFTLQSILRTWLWWHVPSAVVLVILVAVHVVSVVTY